MCLASTAKTGEPNMTQCSIQGDCLYGNVWLFEVEACDTCFAPIMGTTGKETEMIIVVDVRNNLGQ